MSIITGALSGKQITIPNVNIPPMPALADPVLSSMEKKRIILVKSLPLRDIQMSEAFKENSAFLFL